MDAPRWMRVLLHALAGGAPWSEALDIASPQAPTPQRAHLAALARDSTLTPDALSGAGIEPRILAEVLSSAPEPELSSVADRSLSALRDVRARGVPKSRLAVSHFGAVVGALTVLGSVVVSLVYVAPVFERMAEDGWLASAWVPTLGLQVSLACSVGAVGLLVLSALGIGSKRPPRGAVVLRWLGLGVACGIEPRRLRQLMPPPTRRAGPVSTESFTDLVTGHSRLLGPGPDPATYGFEEHPAALDLLARLEARVPARRARGIELGGFVLLATAVATAAFSLYGAVGHLALVIP